MKTSKIVIIGKIGAPYGTKGWIKIHSETAPVDAILDYQPWYLNNSKEPLNIEAIKPHGKQFVAKIDGIETPEAARKYTNKLIAIYRDQLPKPKPGEFYWTDLEGLTVFNKNGIKLGTIDHLMETGANDIIVVSGKKRHLIPYLKDIVIDIDLDKQQMIVDWEEDF